MFKRIQRLRLCIRLSSGDCRVPTLKTSTGIPIPALGLGTWKSKPGEVTQAVKDAIDIGYRHIDGAHVYENEKEVGAGIKAKIAEGVVKREDLFITSKLWNTYRRPEVVETAIKKSLSDLGLDYLDLYLMHFPFALKEGPDLFPVDKNGKTVFADYDYVDTWRAMEAVAKKNLTKLIGISNFNKRQTEKILQCASVMPATNQIECHPYLVQLKLSEFCKSKEVLITAYSPLGSPDRPWATPEDPQPLKDEHIKKLTEKYKRTPAQVLIRYQIQRGHIVLAKSVTKSRIKENFNIWDFELSAEDIQFINLLDCKMRVVPYLDAMTHKDYPFHDEY